MKFKTLAALSVLFLFTIVIPAYADFSVYSSGAEKSICQCSSEKIFLQITNRGVEQDTYFLFMEGEFSDNAKIEKKVIPVEAGSTKRVAVQVNAQCGLPEGKYSVQVNVDSFQTGKRNTQVLNFYVEKCNNIAVFSNESLTRETCAGTTIRHDFILKNPGSYFETYYLQVSQNMNEFAALPRGFTIEPEGTKKFSVLVDTPAGMHGVFDYSLNINARNSQSTAEVPLKLKVSRCMGPYPEIQPNKIQFVKEGPVTENLSFMNTGSSPAIFNIRLNTSLEWLSIPSKISNTSYSIKPGESLQIPLSYNPEATIPPVTYHSNFLVKTENQSFSLPINVEFRHKPERDYLNNLLLGFVVLIGLILLVLLIIFIFRRAGKDKEAKKPEPKERALTEYPLQKEEETTPVLPIKQVLGKRFYHYSLFWILVGVAILIMLTMFFLAGMSIPELIGLLKANFVAFFQNLSAVIVAYLWYILLGIIILCLLIVIALLYFKYNIFSRLAQEKPKESKKKKIKVKHYKEAEEFAEPEIGQESELISEKTREKLRNFFRSRFFIPILIIVLVLLALLLLYVFGIITLSSTFAFAYKALVWMITYSLYLLAGVLLLLLLLLGFYIYERYQKKPRKRKQNDSVLITVSIILLILLIGFLGFFLVSDNLLQQLGQEKAQTQNVTDDIVTDKGPEPPTITNFTETRHRFIWNTNSVKVVNLSEYFVDPDNDPLNYSVSKLENIYTHIDNRGFAYLLPNYSWVGHKEIYFTAADPGGGVIDTGIIDLYVLPENESSSSNYYVKWPMNEEKELAFQDYFADPDLDELTLKIEQKPANIDVSVDNSRKIILLSPELNWHGHDLLRLKATDEQGNTAITPPIQLRVTEEGQYKSEYSWEAIKDYINRMLGR